MKQELYQDLERVDYNDFLDGWVFTYSSSAKLFLATNRDNYHKLFSDMMDDSVITSNNLYTLKEIIINCQGNLKEVIKFKKRFN